ncbi:MAG: DUF5610 domain-containing protein [Candidatus Riflebacteria bacterium]|nr:DUF5610 domain-containing protein [Candidatus Riflebacteria bacterium]
MIDPISPIQTDSPSTSKITEVLPATTSESSDITTTNSDVADPLNGLNIDNWNLSSKAKSEIQYARIQFELTYLIFHSMRTSQVQQSTMDNFSSLASDKLFHKVSGLDPVSAVSTPIIPANSFDNKTDTTAQKISNASNALTRLQEYFSPERTARRVLDVFSSLFDVSKIAKDEGNTEASRKKFANFIENAFSDGFKQAASRSGKLSKDVQEGVDKTHSLITSGLADFAKNGIDAKKASSRSFTEKITAYQQESAQHFDQVKKSFAPSDYNAQGELQAITMDIFSKTV